jgi:hypothetical protein
MIKKMSHYIEDLKKLYPDEDEKVLKKVVRSGFSKMILNLSMGEELKLKSVTNNNDFNMLVYTKRFLPNATKGN